MDVYLVGGAVRDRRLNLPVTERDYVVVGSNRQAMLDLGYRQVGRDFPVFLHPDTGDEYALARTERKTGPGHTGFEVYAGAEVTLEEDLQRRDLTINAMAETADGTLIDPCGGAADLAAGCLRHVSEAFSEDPLRVFRVARFAARFARQGFEKELGRHVGSLSAGELKCIPAWLLSVRNSGPNGERGGAQFLRVRFHAATNHSASTHSTHCYHPGNGLTLN